jgi:Uma2 family endonuclease
MTRPASPERRTVDEYFALVAEGVLAPEDRVELIEGVVVTVSPQNPRHAAGVRRTAAALSRALGDRAVVQTQLPLIAGRHSVPEPDVAVLPGGAADYDHVHPAVALLVVEVADASLVQDRVTKAGLYAAAGIPEYWIVNLRDDRVEVSRDPDVAARFYRTSFVVGRDARLELTTLPAVCVAATDLLPAPVR